MTDVIVRARVLGMPRERRLNKDVRSEMSRAVGRQIPSPGECRFNRRHAGRRCWIVA